jgi:hypothetical protein
MHCVFQIHDRTMDNVQNCDSYETKFICIIYIYVCMGLDLQQICSNISDMST